jgi:hypothetical protein
MLRTSVFILNEKLLKGLEEVTMLSRTMVKRLVNVLVVVMVSYSGI